MLGLVLDTPLGTPDTAGWSLVATSAAAAAAAVVVIPAVAASAATTSAAAAPAVLDAPAPATDYCRL